MATVEMAENVEAKSKGFSIDWLVKGTLTKVGDIFDRLTGRGWRPSSGLATSGLIDRMKRLMDTEAREDKHGRRYVPHNVQLKMQWDKFSTDSKESLQTLENELLIAAVDHINDRHYYTYSPISIDIKPDYFTSGVVLSVSFDRFDTDENEAAINVTVDGLTKAELVPDAERERKSLSVQVSFQAGGKSICKVLEFEEGKRISVGRTKENGLQIDDQSISKAHASFLLNKDGKLVVADTGSTNGTFVAGQRIAYGKAVEVTPGAALMFGLVNVSLEFAVPKTAMKTEVLPSETQSYKIGDFEFSSRSGSEAPLPTVRSLPLSNGGAQPTVGIPEKGPTPIMENAREEATAPVDQPALTEPTIRITENGAEPKK